MISIKHNQKCIHCGKKVISFRQKSHRDFRFRPAHRTCWIKDNEKKNIERMIRDFCKKS